MRTKALLQIVALSSVLGLACSWQTQERNATAQQESQTQESKAPTVQIEVAPIVKLDEPLTVRWKIINTSAKPIYIYSTFLQSTGTVAEVDFDAARMMVELRFSVLEPLQFFVNAFPDAKFMEIGSNESREGTFTSNSSIKEGKFFGAVNHQPDVKSLTNRTWQARIAVAYGYEIKFVEKAIAAWGASEDDPHPINPIIRWQKIAYSEPVGLTFRK